MLLIIDSRGVLDDNATCHDCYDKKVYVRLCLRVWRGERGKVLRGGKYEGKWRNLLIFCKKVIF